MDKFLEFIKKVQAISHTGLTYSEDEYAIENYEELRELSIKMLNEYTEKPIEDCDLYENYYYPTPQPAVRTLVIKDDKILFVKEKESGKWSLPGGWCDIDSSPKEAAVLEVKQESGYIVEITKLLGVLDRRNYRKSTYYDVYNICFLAHVIGGESRCNHETSDVKWFSFDNLPELSTKITKDEINIIYDVYINNKESYFE